jgi:Txe/YoeB family toxin of Txe-Axe toxin-antitoxin module
VKKICVAMILVFSQSILAKVEVYQSTDNTGLNKLERIDGVEKYLIDLSATLKNMETKLDEQSKKMEEVSKEIASLKDNEAKRIQSALGQKTTDATAITGEVEKLRADFTTLKNEDIERLTRDVLQLKDKLQDMRDQTK